MRFATTVDAHTFTDGWSAHAPVELVWCEDDPLVLTISCDSGSGSPVVSWWVDRALVAAAFGQRCVGDGDVEVRAPGAFVTFVVRPPGVPATFLVMSRTPVSWLLAEAERLVPSGGEDESSIVDAELELLLASWRDVA